MKIGGGLFTGSKDTDQLILLELTPREFLQMSYVNQEINRKLYTDDLYFRRIKKDFPNYTGRKSEGGTWNRFYLKTIIEWENAKEYKSQICEKIQRLIAKNKINPEMYYLETLEDNNAILNYITDKVKEEDVYRNIPTYFEATYKRYFANSPYAAILSPKRNVTETEKDYLKNEILTQHLNNKYLNPEFSDAITTLITLGFINIDIKIKDLCNKLNSLE